MRKSTTTVGILTFLAVLCALMVADAAADERPTIEDMIASAATPADHEAIAARYEEEAAEAKAEAERHEAMLERYKKRGAAYLTKTHVDHHCAALIKAYRNVSEENAKLAEAHRALAK